MAKANFLIICGIVFFQLSAVAQDTSYFNSIWKETSKDKASYYRTKTKTETGWHATDHFISGKVQMTGNYADDSCHVSQGEFVWYDDNGVANHRCNYVKGKLDGVDTLYYPDGLKKMAGKNKEGEKQGEWLGYYQNGKISGKAKHERGKQVSAVFFHEDGSPNKSISSFMKQSEYPGGVPQFLRFLNKTLRYPDTAVNYEIQGTVIVSFKVSKEGKASEFRVIQSVDQSLDAEALRVLKMMPDWDPAIIGGILSDSYYSQPVVFHL